LNSLSGSAEPGCAADAAGAACGLGAIYPAIRYGLLTTKHPPTFRCFERPSVPGAPPVGRTRIAWYLPPATVLHRLHACQRRS